MNNFEQHDVVATNLWNNITTNTIASSGATQPRPELHLTNNNRVALKQTQTTTTQQSWRFTKEICNYCVKLQISITCPTIEAFINNNYNNIIDCSSTKWATITAYNTATNNRTQKQTTVEELKTATTPAASTTAPQYKRQVHLAGLAWQGLQHIFTPQSNSDNKIQKSSKQHKINVTKGGKCL